MDGNHDTTQDARPGLQMGNQVDAKHHSEPRLGSMLGPELEERLAFSSSDPQQIIPLPPLLNKGDHAGDNTRISRAEHPLPPLPAHVEEKASRIDHPDPRRRPLSVHRSSRRNRSALDWIVPMSSSGGAPRERTVSERLDPTLITAVREKEKYAFSAKMTGYCLNLAIGVQVLLGSLTTGLAVVVSGREAQVVTAVLGGLATLVASYLARARGSNEPELSIARVKDLEQFIRECEAYKMDNGNFVGEKYDADVQRFRNRFEELLGNANGERKLSPPV